MDNNEANIFLIILSLSIVIIICYLFLRCYRNSLIKVHNTDSLKNLCKNLKRKKAVQPLVYGTELHEFKDEKENIIRNSQFTNYNEDNV